MAARKKSFIQRMFGKRRLRGFLGKRLGDKGTALVLTFFLSTVGIILAVAATHMIVQSQQESIKRIRMVSESDTAARAGIVEALTWFRAQSSGVANNTSHIYGWQDESFFPRQTILTGTTQDRQTIDESIGLVREFQIGMAPNGMQKWVRYEVHRQHWPTTNAQGTPYPTPTTGSTPVTPVPWDKYAAHDISGERILPQNMGNTPTPVVMVPTATATATVVLPKDGDGNVWSVNSIGYVYLRPNTSPSPTPAAYNKPPCQIVSQSGLSSEFRRVTMNGPWICGTTAAIYTTYLNYVTIGFQGEVDAGSTGIGYITQCSSGPTCSYTLQSGGKINYGTGSSDATTIASSCGSNALSANTIFGMGLSDLKKLADFASSSVADMYSATVTPRSLPDDKLFYLDGAGATTFIFDSNNKFDGSGVMVINGNLDVQNPTSPCRPLYFHGLVYVTGTTVLENDVYIDGALISLGGVKVSQTGACDLSDVSYSLASLNTAQQTVLNYREDQTETRMFTGILQR